LPLGNNLSLNLTGSFFVFAVAFFFAAISVYYLFCCCETNFVAQILPSNKRATKIQQINDMQKRERKTFDNIFRSFNLL